ncbi:MAG: hypothetical protein WA837_10680 [Xanthobacteraceae bacterium]
MRVERGRSLLRLGSALAIVLALGACTRGGQFDPTEVFNSDVFDSKKKLSGQRQAVFPGGVPGTTTGVPADLVKGYQPPPDPADSDAAQTAGGGPPAPGQPASGQPAAGAARAGAPVATAEAKPKPKPKPKPKLASTPAQGQDPVWNKGRAGPATGGPTRINVGAKPAASAPSGAQDQGAASQANWPAPAQQVQTNWPSPTGAPAQKTAQPSQSVWPNPSSTTQ